VKILFVLDDGLTQTSAWVRAVQYRPLLSARGVQAEFISHRPARLARLQAWLIRKGSPARLRGLVKRVSLLIAFWREGTIARKAKEFDVVYVLLVPSARLYRKLQGGPHRVFLDVIDALWLPSRLPLWKDLPEILALVDGVICENRFAAEYLRRFNPNVSIVHDAPQVEAFDARRLRSASLRGEPAASDRVVLGWIGSPSACDALFAIFEPLERLFAKHPHLHLRIVGADPERIPRFENVSWSLRRTYDLEGMVDEVLGMDIGLFPLFRTEESVMRGTLKAMVYMSGEAVAVCSPVGENVDLIRDGVNGVLADSPQEWFDRLEELVLDPQRRARIAAEGLKTVREHFSRERGLDALLTAFQGTMQPALKPSGAG